MVKRPTGRAAPRRRTGFVSRKVRAVTSAASKAAGYSALRLAFDGGQLVLSASAVELRRELLMLRVDLSSDGGERIEAGSGHDDMADALMLAGCPYRPRGATRWRHLLSELAAPSARLPDAVVPVGADAGDTVATGGGLVLPRAPWWQSVRGPEVSPPPGVPVPADELERPRDLMETPIR